MEYFYIVVLVLLFKWRIWRKKGWNVVLICTTNLLTCKATCADLCWLNCWLHLIADVQCVYRMIVDKSRTGDCYNRNVIMFFNHFCLSYVSSQRSHSAFSLLDNDPPDLIQDSPQALKKEGGGSALSTWKSVDRLDNAGKILLLIALTS